MKKRIKTNFLGLLVLILYKLYINCGAILFKAKICNARTGIYHF